MSSKGQCCAECFILWEETFASRVSFILYSGDLGMDHGVGSQRTALRNAQEKAVTRRKHSYKFEENQEPFKGRAEEVAW